LRVTDEDSKDVKLCSEDDSCVKGSRIRKAVPPAAASELSLGLLKGREKLRRDREELESFVRRCTVSKFSAGSGIFYPGFSETQEVRIVRADKAR